MKRKTIGIACAIVGLVYCGAMARLYYSQGTKVFPGHKSNVAREREIHADNPQLEDISFTAADGVILRGYFLPRQCQGRLAPVVLYFPGNAEEQTRFFQEADNELPDMSLAGLDYRGYGHSQGKPSEMALKADALAEYDQLAARLGPDARIAVMGRSLGTALAAHVAANRSVACVVLITPYASLTDVSLGMYSLVPAWIMRSFMKYPFDVLPDAARVTAPTLMLVAGSDRRIPPLHAARLAIAWAGPKAVHTVDRAGHDTIMANPVAWDWIREFFKERLGVAACL